MNVTCRRKIIAPRRNLFAFQGHNYLTLVYQIDPGARRLLWLGEQRTQATMESFFKDMTALKSDFSEQIKVICSCFGYDKLLNLFYRCCERTKKTYPELTEDYLRICRSVYENNDPEDDLK